MNWRILASLVMVAVWSDKIPLGVPVTGVVPKWYNARNKGT